MKSAFLDAFQLHSNSERIGFYFQEYEGLDIPELRLSAQHKPATDGAQVGNQLYGGRAITLIGKVSGDDIETYRSRRRQLIQAVSRRLIDGDITPRIFKFTTMDDLTLRLPVYTQDFKFTDELLFGDRYRLNLYSEQEYLEGDELKLLNIYVFSGGGMAIPMGIPMSMGNGGSAESEAVNGGDSDSYPVIVFHGELEDPTLTNQTTGEQIGLTYTLTEGERIEIDTKNQTALYFTAPDDPEGANVLQYVTGDWLKITSGTNVLKLVTAVYNTVGYVSIQWRDKYLGV